ncbi:hypothetical protein Mgra_00004792, partial [Meloidogyne graminicola]
IKTLNQSVFTFHVHFEWDETYENEYYFTFNNYLGLIYSFTKTNVEIIAPQHYAQFYNFRIRQDTYNLYQLFFSSYVSSQIELQNTLQQFYLNKELIKQMSKQFREGTLVYDSNLILKINSSSGRDIPPQIREIIIPYIVGASSSHQGEASSSHQDPGP